VAFERPLLSPILSPLLPLLSFIARFLSIYILLSPLTKSVPSTFYTSFCYFFFASPPIRKLKRNNFLNLSLIFVVSNSSLQQKPIGDKEPNIIEHISMSWSYIMMYLHATHQRCSRLRQNWGIILRNVFNNSWQELCHCPDEQLQRGVRRVINDEVKRPSLCWESD